MRLLDKRVMSVKKSMDNLALGQQMHRVKGS